jgi:hypothetical protein
MSLVVMLACPALLRGPGVCADAGTASSITRAAGFTIFIRVIL